MLAQFEKKIELASEIIFFSKLGEWLVEASDMSSLFALHSDVFKRGTKK